MKTNYSLGIIKPDAFKKKVYGKIINEILSKDFEIIKMKIDLLYDERPKNFYLIHKDKKFFSDLINFMTSGPIIPIIVKKNNAVVAFRELIGSTNPQEASKDTIRFQFANNIQENAIHGSDSIKNAIKEIVFFFPSFQI